jgi:hypothetical protein
MPSLINSDDGVVSGSAGLKTTGGNDGILVFQSSGTETARITSGVLAVSATSTTASTVRLYEDTDNGSNYVDLIAPTSVASNKTITLPDGTGTVAVNGVSGVLVSGTAITLTNQTAPEFTSIPSWVRRVTVMFQGVSTNGTNPVQIQIGSGSYTTSGYVSSGARVTGAGSSVVNSTVGFIINSPAISDIVSGNVTITNITSNSWTAAFSGKGSTTLCVFSGGDVSLSGTLDRLRIVGSTTGSPTDTFDLGTINIMWE